jgi:hypothetical protein
MDTVRVEGFSSSLRGRKLWILGDEALLPNRLHVVEQELLGRGRSLLIIADGRKMPRWASKIEWDSIYRLKDTQDLRLALTYIGNAARPLRVVWLGEEPSHPVLQRLHHQDVTLFGVGPSQPKGEWDALFFPSSYEANRIEESLLSRMGSLRLAALNLKSVVPELKAVRAGLVWSSIGESEKAGAVYWYDVTEGESAKAAFNPIEMAETLREFADRISASK